MNSVEADTRVRTLRAVSDALERADREEFRRLVWEIGHPDCEWSALITAVEGGGYRGREGMMAFFDDLAGSFSIRYRDREYRPVGDRVLFLTTMELRGAESGAAIEREAGVVFEFEEGLVRRAHVYDSHAQAIAQVEGLGA